MKNLKYMGFTLFGLIILIAGYVYYLSLQRDSKTWTEDIQVAKNTSIPIEIMHSQKKYHGGHAFGWGGGDIKNHIKFKYNDIEYIHKSPYIPIVIKLYEERFYLVCFDRETHIRETTFRFYKSTNKGTFKEIDATDYPKHLAIQNRWFKGDNKPERLENLNPQKLIGTMTVDIWYMIEGKQTLFTHNTTIPIEFIENYKEKNITNRKNKN